MAKPEKLGFSSQRLARINTVMQRYIDEGKLAGIVTLVARRNQVVHFEKCGMAEIETGQPMALDTIFRIYSMTKPITSAAVLMLLEEGQLRLNDPVAHYIPAFRTVKVLDNSSDSGGRLVDPIRPINIRDLLTHTAGLSYGFEDNVYIDELYRKLWGQLDADPAFTLKDRIETLAQIPLVYQPGTRYRYSMATDVLGYLVEVIAGMPFAQFLQQRIFDPLHMPDTSFYVPEQKIARFAANYGPSEQGGGLQVIDAPRTSHYINPTKRGLGRWRPGFHDRRLSALCPNVAQPRRIGRRALVGPQDHRIDDKQLLAGRR